MMNIHFETFLKHLQDLTDNLFNRKDITPNQPDEM